jgi:integrase
MPRQNAVRLTDRGAAALILPAGKTDHVFWDFSLPSFGLRLRGDRKSCSKSWLVQYRANGQQRREALGDIRKVKIDDARRAARKIFAQVELGVDPAAEKAKARTAAAAATLTLGVVADRYLASKQPTLRPNSYAQAAGYLINHWRPLRDRPLAEIKRADVAVQLQDLVTTRGPIAAARARGHLSALFAWSMREGLVDRNPVVNTNAPDKGVKPRDRVLNGDELKAIWAATNLDDDFSRIVRLLILTACRRNEIGGLEWSEIDFDTGTLTISGRRTKNGRALQLKLPATAMNILRAVPRRDGSVCLFGKPTKGLSSWSHGMQLLQARMAAAGTSLPHWTLHDLRRSVATRMAEELNIQPHIIEALLNHVSGHKRGVAGIYNRASYGREIAVALQLWAEHLSALIESRKRKIVTLNRRP